MRTSRFAVSIAAVCLLSAALGAAGLAQDWPQWRGPDRTGLSKETGLLKTWPAEGPKLLWKTTNLGEGHATPSVAGGVIYGMGLREGNEVVWALDEKTGKELWNTRIAGGIRLDGGQGGYGSRATPTVDGNRIYTLGVGGDIVCLNRSDGKLLWNKNLVTDFGGGVPTWGYSESPLVDGDKVIVTPGGAGAAIVALNKSTGETIWKANVPEGGGVSYSSAIVATVNGKRQYIQFLSGCVVGVSASDGKLLWKFAGPANRNGINCSTPIYQDGYVFAASSYQHGGALGKLSSTGDLMSAEQVYFTRDMKNHHGGMVLIGDYLYGFDERTLTCLEFKTGKVIWTNPSVGKGSVTYVDGMLVCRSERGPVALVEANPKEYVEKGRFEQPDRSRDPSWPYPVVANGKLLLRDQGVLLCYDVKGSK